MLTAAQRHAVDHFTNSLEALGDDALLDTYHQAAEDYAAARTEGSDNLDNAHAQMLAAQQTMQDRFPDCRARYRARYP